MAKVLILAIKIPFTINFMIDNFDKSIFLYDNLGNANYLKAYTKEDFINS